ncbi:hypothetical protein [Soonwooa sp.]|uniref:hypothetical protein n=1 Tax=Soonwooa sp. TaxID=1938592 RepID=UPI002896E503|nr:hypothetical protein [Soonwooa sp.]
MKLSFKILVVVGAFLITSSCDSTRDITGDSLVGVNYGNTNTSVKKLKKIEDTNGDGDVLTTTYTYDADKLTKVYSKSSHGNEYTYVLVYNGTELSQIKQTQKEEGESQMDTTYDLVYTGGKLTSMKAVAKSSDVEVYNIDTQFRYSASNISGAKSTFKNGTSEMGSLDSTLGFTGANLTSFKLTSTVPIFPKVEMLMSNFDDKKNPFANFPEAFKAFSMNFMLGSSSPVAMFSQNNYKTIKVVGDSVSYDMTYTYNTDNYPVAGTRSDNGGKITFEYY